MVKVEQIRLPLYHLPHPEVVFRDTVRYEIVFVNILHRQFWFCYPYNAPPGKLLRPDQHKIIFFSRIIRRRLMSA